MGQRIYDFDADLILKDAGLVNASAAAQVGGSDKILNVGAARMDATVLIDVTAVEIASADEKYDVILQGSNSPSFASGIQNLAQMNFGATAVRQGGAQNSTTGRYEMPFTNYQDDTVYQYLRLFNVVAGSIASGINYAAFIGKQAGR